MTSSWIKCAFLSAVMLLVFIAPFGEALKCYQCSTLVSKGCEGPTPDRSFEVDCSNANDTHVAPENKQEQGKGTFCRKQHQDVEGRINIIRSCGFVRSAKPCYSTANPPTKTVVCQCEGELCNAAPGLFNPVLALALPVLACLTYYFRN